MAHLFLRSLTEPFQELQTTCSHLHPCLSSVSLHACMCTIYMNSSRSLNFSAQLQQPYPVQTLHEQ